MTRLDLAGLAFSAVALLAAGGLKAQEYPAYAPRCTMSELTGGAGRTDACKPQYAHFGLSGPSAMGDPAFDVDVTGSVESRGASQTVRTPD